MPRPESFPNPNPSEVLNRAKKELATLVNDKEVIFGQPCPAAKLVFELNNAGGWYRGDACILRLQFIFKSTYTFPTLQIHL